MKNKPAFLFALYAAMAFFATFAFSADTKNKEATWTDPVKAGQEDPSFSIQGEYGFAKEGAEWGLQVIAMGDGKLEAYLLEGGLPGLGFTKGKQRIKLAGSLTEDKRSASLREEKEEISVSISDAIARVSKKSDLIATLPHVQRKSPTLGKKPPQEALILFDGSSADAWEKGEVVDGLLRNNDIKTKEKFGSYHLHLEFRTPYKPFARGQGRGNSGVYHQHRYETQVLDAFGLEGKNNETGGIYSIAPPLHNMCLPPLVWQTYDVDLEAAKFDAEGKLLAPAELTVRLNGVLIHDKQKVDRPTPGSGLQLSPEPGPIFIQGHGNPVFYRNIWLIKK